MIILTGNFPQPIFRAMKRLLFCLIVLFCLGVVNSQAADSTATKKDADVKPAAPSPGLPPLPNAGDAKTTPPKTAPAKEVAVIKTSMGEMVAEFWPDVAPKHVENFKSLAKKGFYDGTAFHRVIRGFMIQGGDPNTKDENAKSSWGQGGPGYHINAEFNNKKHVLGVLSMARTNDPNSAGSQFFICLENASHLDNQYTAFGKLIKGEDVLKKIGSTPTGARDMPLERVNVESIKIVGIDTIK
jgi:peptidyl-prolyl cis-trans isomerase B (cyclophilin B)